jgi:hypothetical protein
MADSSVHHHDVQSLLSFPGRDFLLRNNTDQVTTTILLFSSFFFLISEIIYGVSVYVEILILINNE